MLSCKVALTSLEPRPKQPEHAHVPHTTSFNCQRRLFIHLQSDVLQYKRPNRDGYGSSEGTQRMLHIQGTYLRTGLGAGPLCLTRKSTSLILANLVLNVRRIQGGNMTSARSKMGDDGMAGICRVYIWRPGIFSSLPPPLPLQT